MATKSVNEMQRLGSAGWLRYNNTASANTVIPAGSRIMAIHLGAGSTTSSLIVCNETTVTGSDQIKLTALAAGNSAVISFAPAGTVYDIGTSTTLAGTGATYNIYYVTD